MIRTLKNLFKQDRERYTVPRRVQDTIPVRRIWKDGIFMTGNKSVSYTHLDVYKRKLLLNISRLQSATLLKLYGVRTV